MALVLNVVDTVFFTPVNGLDIITDEWKEFSGFFVLVLQGRFELLFGPVRHVVVADFEVSTGVVVSSNESVLDGKLAEAVLELSGGGVGFAILGDVAEEG